MLIAAIFISLFLGAGIVSGVAYTARSVERSTHAREVKLLTAQLTIEQGRTADLLTRLAARNLGEYQAAVTPFVDDTPRREYITDDTGLIAVELDAEEVS